MQLARLLGIAVAILFSRLMTTSRAFAQADDAGAPPSAAPAAPPEPAAAEGTTPAAGPEAADAGPAPSTGEPPPTAPCAPTRKVLRSKVISRGYSNDAATPDVGVLVLEKPITLAQYAIPTSIGAAADLGSSYRGVAVGRSFEARTAPLVRSTVLTITTGKSAGYTSGLHTPYYSTGGDSGGPLFLVENGKLTHKVVGVERQPDPPNDADWFTRIDAGVLALVHP